MINPNSIRINNHHTTSHSESVLDHRKLCALKTMIRWLQIKPDEWLSADSTRTEYQLGLVVELLESIIKSGAYDNWLEKELLNRLREEYLHSLNKNK